MALQQYYNAFGLIVPLRKAIFKPEYMEKWKSTHEMVVAAPVSPTGYPDTGAGRYSKGLPYEEWYKFNIAQRVHGNSVEHLVHSIPLLLLSGIFYPKFITFLGITMVAGREAYMNGYLREGPDSSTREFGAMTINLSEILIIGFLMGVGVWRGFLRKPILGLKTLKIRRKSLMQHHIDEVIKKDQGKY